MLSDNIFQKIVKREIELAAGPPLVDFPITIDFDEQGRLYVSESSGSSEKAASGVPGVRCQKGRPAPSGSRSRSSAQRRKNAAPTGGGRNVTRDQKSEVRDQGLQCCL